MAKKKEESPEAEPNPIPVNRAVRSGMVKVRAIAHLGEFIDGEIQRFAPGDEFQLDAERAKSLPNLVEILE